MAEFVAKALEILQPKATDPARLDEVVKEVIAANGKSVADYKSGKTNALMFLVGQAMKEMKGKADGALVGKKVKEFLQKA